MPHVLRFKNHVVAVLSEDNYQLHPDIEALSFDDPRRTAIEQTAETLLNVRSIVGHFDYAPTPARRR